VWKTLSPSEAQDKRVENPLAKVAMVALSGFVVIPHHAYSVDDIREPVLELMGRAGHGLRRKNKVVRSLICNDRLRTPSRLLPPLRLALHHGAQDAVDTSLITPAGGLEPLQNVLIKTYSQLLLGRRPGNQRLFEERISERRDVRVIDIFVPKAVNLLQVAFDRFSAHVHSPFAGDNPCRIAARRMCNYDDTSIEASERDESDFPIIASRILERDAGAGTQRSLRAGRRQS
jgi:hypothetical protein